MTSERMFIFPVITSEKLPHLIGVEDDDVIVVQGASAGCLGDNIAALLMRLADSTSRPVLLEPEQVEPVIAFNIALLELKVHHLYETCGCFIRVLASSELGPRS